MNDCIVTHADPRLLVVNITTSVMRICVVVGHAPHLRHDKCVRDEWWQRLSSKVPSNREAIFLMDANAKVGS